MKNISLTNDDINIEFVSINKLFCGLDLVRTKYDDGGESSHRPLCLLAVDNSAESICLYCYFIKEKIPFLLVDASTSKERLQQIIHCFQPAYLFVPEGEADFLPSLDYDRKETYGQYVCWQFMMESVWQRQRVAQELAVLLSTSGSTGSSKFVVLTYENLEIYEHMNEKEDDFLEEHDYSREEIEEGIHRVLGMAGVELPGVLVADEAYGDN